MLYVQLEDGRVIGAPLAWYPRLLHATREQRRHYELTAGGYGIHWPDIDEDLSVEGLLRGAPAAPHTVPDYPPSDANFSAELLNRAHRAGERWAESMRNYPGSAREFPVELFQQVAAPKIVTELQQAGLPTVPPELIDEAMFAAMAAWGKPQR
jgi:hypothetical protein